MGFHPANMWRLPHLDGDIDITSKEHRTCFYMFLSRLDWDATLFSL
jgi:hypothetical protein